MLFLISLYKWPLLAGVLVAPALALIGCHLAARDKAMQTLCVGQGATLGVLFGLEILLLQGADAGLITAGPFVTAVLVSVATYFGSDAIAAHQASRNTFYSAIFAALLATSYLVCALFPQLENHMTQIFFGDLATLSNVEAFISIALAIFAVAALLMNHRSISRESFEVAMFGDHFVGGRKTRSRVLFSVLSLLALALSVQFLGFLFTVAMLFLPTVMVLGTPSRGLKSHYALAAGLAGVSTAIGFLGSLYFSRLPTVPLIVCVLLLVGGFAITTSRVVLSRASR